MAKAAKSQAATKKVKDPFKTRKTRTEVSRETDTVEPPPDVARAIDEFRHAQEQAKHYEGEMTIHKDKILSFSQEEYARRFFNGQPGSFKIVGDETMVTFVIQDSSAGLTEEDVQQFADKWGEKAAEDLIQRDYRSIRFDPDVLAANYDKVVEALQALPEEVLDNLFQPMLMMAKPGALDLAKKYAKSSDDLIQILKDLKIKNYIR